MINILNNPVVLQIRKHAPEILTGLGIASFITSTVFACKATSKVSEVLEDHKDEMETINEVEYKYDYNKQEIVKLKAEKLGKTSLELVKLYSPAVGFAVLGTTCVLGGYGIMRKRNAALGAAYAFVSGKFGEYRDRVKAELGDEKDKEFYHGLKKETVTVEQVDENGKKKKVKEEITVVDPASGKSLYAKVFDDSSEKWVNNAEMNLVFLRNQQNWFNDKLREKGHVFLNEVYDALGMPRTSAGAIVGWVIDGTFDSDNYIDFGIYSIENQENRDFINGYEPNIFLDFNVDGVIYDLI